MASTTHPTQTAVTGSLEAVQARIETALSGASGRLGEAVRLLPNRRGKHIRPLLVLLSAGAAKPAGRSNGRASEAVLDVAAAVELIHVASLIHDDIIDGAATRRGGPAVSARFDNHTAVLAGDYLFAAAFGILSSYARLGMVTLMTRAIADMCRGEILQREQAFSVRLTEAGYRQRIKGKTAALLAAACEAGARLVEASDEICAAMRAYGLNLGLAYQIWDDLLDLDGDRREMGKPAGSDLRQGVVTLPVIYLLEDDRWRACIAPRIANREIDDETLALVREGMRQTGADQRAKSVAEAYARAAIGRLRILNAFSKQGQNEKTSAGQLEALCHQAVGRTS